jgi:hypothetical protein
VGARLLWDFRRRHRGYVGIWGDATTGNLRYKTLLDSATHGQGIKNHDLTLLLNVGR